jgi:hypothetical protein
MDVWIQNLLTSALLGGEWSASRLSRFTSGTHWIGGCVQSRSGRRGEEKILDPTGT